MSLVRNIPGASPAWGPIALSLGLALSLAACGGDSSDSSQLSAPAATAAPTPAKASSTAPAQSTIGSVATASVTASTTTSATTAAPAAVPGAVSSATSPAIPANSKSISAWVSCTGTTDDTSGAIKAFAAARNNAFTLLVDCPVRLHSGLAIDRGIFIDSGTSVQFTASGKFLVDNMFHPAFVIANSSQITLTNWNVEWDGSVPVDPNFGGYELNGEFVASPGETQPAGAFNDLVLTAWLAANRSITFDEKKGRVESIWVGGVNPAAVFFITGDSSSVVFSGLKLYVPPAAGGNAFMPMAISLSANWKSKQTVTGTTPETTQYAAVPHGITFSGIDLDGIYMGWQGNLQDSLFENITSHRYGDLQDAKGKNVGGIGKWYPPPHLFYINTHAADAGLDNINVHFSNITDEGVRVGVARDTPGDSGSGFANSLKLSCTDCSVDTYTSHRPDGFMDVLAADGMTVSNVTATFDSQFINNLYPAGLRFPMTSYSHVTFENLNLTDTADSTIQGPIGNSTSAANRTIVFSGVSITMNKWAGSDMPLPSLTGTGNHVAINFTMSAQAMKLAFLETGSMTVWVAGTPAIVRPDGSTVIKWDSRHAEKCSANGAWAGTIAGSGSRSVAVSAAGSYPFTLNCQSAGGSADTTMSVEAQQ